MGDALVAWFTFLLGLSGIGAVYSVVVNFIRTARGGLR